jgi:hypothetical protein
MLRTLLTAGIFLSMVRSSSRRPALPRLSSSDRSRSTCRTATGCSRRVRDPTGIRPDQQNCLACDATDMVLNQPALSTDAWTAEVNKMINTSCRSAGCQRHRRLSDEEQRQIELPVADRLRVMSPTRLAALPGVPPGQRVQVNKIAFWLPELRVRITRRPSCQQGANGAI